jgi:sortase (surface protein transpeptidase)
MRRYLIGSALAASLLLSSCAVPERQTGAVPASDQIVAPAPAATASAPGAGTGGNSPDPAAIRKVPQPVDAAPPVQAEVPGIGGIPILPVGVTADGQAEIPEDISRVGWYQYGSAPGDGEGSVVLMGHRDSRGGKGVLFTLPVVEVGTQIVVTDAEGVRHPYRVVSNESISKTVVPLGDLFARQGPPRLLLVSCGGPYDRDRGGYLENVIVTAVPA